MTRQTGDASARAIYPIHCLASSTGMIWNAMHSPTEGLATSIETQPLPPLFYVLNSTKNLRWIL